MLAALSIVVWQSTYRVVYLPLRAPAILARVVSGAGSEADIRWLVGNRQKLLLSGATLKNLDLRRLDDAPARRTSLPRS